jgi:hypothetical protein
MSPTTPPGVQKNWTEGLCASANRGRHLVTSIIDAAFLLVCGSSHVTAEVWGTQ